MTTDQKSILKKRYNMSEVARKTKLSMSYISRVFEGTRIPRLHNAHKIAVALEMTLDKLYGYLKKYYK